ncbi:hypothetical protein [Kribbella deserti]|uniref:Lipoprotein n=1 Tax=Kribbella deserti TaxID=1926257 RepID=A0ABV6QVB6_9ACTN
MALLAAASLILTGCSGEQAPSAEPAPPVIRLPENLNADSLVLYNRFTQRLLAYDQKSFTVTQESNQQNFIQYAFPVVSEYFTAGDSKGDDFSVLRVRGNRIEEVVELPPNSGIFPLATDGKQWLYTKSDYVEGRETHRVLVAVDPDGSHREYAGATGLIDSGAIIGHTLYFTTFDEPTEKYSLSSLDLRSLDAKPKPLSKGLPAGGLYVHNGLLYTSTATQLVNGKDAFDCKEFCYFYDQAGVLLRIFLNKEASLVLDVIDSRTKKVITSRKDLVDFTVSGGTLVVYRRDGIDRIPLSSKAAS